MPGQFTQVQQAISDALQQGAKMGMKPEQVVSQVRQSAAKAGWPSAVLEKELQGFGLGTAPVAPSVHPDTGDTLGGESGLSGILGLLKQGYDAATTHSPSEWGGDLMNTLKGAGQGIAQNAKTELGRSADAAKDLAPMTALQHLFGAVLPQSSHFQDNVVSGNAGGAAGDLLGLFGPEAAGKALDLTRKGATAAGENIYRGPLPFDKTKMSQGDIRSAVKTGIEGELPAEKLFSKPSERTTDVIGSVGAPGTILDDMDKIILPHTTGAAGMREVNPQTVLNPLVSEIRSVLKGPTKTSASMAAKMLDEDEPFLRELSPALGWVMDQGVPSTEKLDIIEKWMKDPRLLKTTAIARKGESLFNPLESHLTMERAQSASRGINSTLDPKAFNDKMTGILPGQTQAQQLLRKGLKDGMNEIAPGIGDVNSRMRDVINLRNAFDDIAKQNPKDVVQTLHHMIGVAEYGLGGAGIGSVISGHVGGLPLSVGASLGIALKKALDSPRFATNLGIALGGKFPKLLDAIAPFTHSTAAHLPGPAGRILGSSNPPLQQ